MWTNPNVLTHFGHLRQVFISQFVSHTDFVLWLKVATTGNPRSIYYIFQNLQTQFISASILKFWMSEQIFSLYSHINNHSYLKQFEKLTFSILLPILSMPPIKGGTFWKRDRKHIKTNLLRSDNFSFYLKVQLNNIFRSAWIQYHLDSCSGPFESIRKYSCIQSQIPYHFCWKINKSWCGNRECMDAMTSG